jgi:NAD(P)-dependent dehydrogenase (short-subunit alcohol dehydrogenase family)
VLVNNAGIGDLAPGGGTRRESDDGFELLFAVNYLARYALTPAASCAHSGTSSPACSRDDAFASSGGPG